MNMNRSSRKVIHSNLLESPNKKTISSVKDKKHHNKGLPDYMMNGRNVKEKYKKKEMSYSEKNKNYAN